ncbi:MAG TPA: nitrate/sulfonate/bicarbonate ABC transporter ATP-binding protein [Caulobacteraceae bacterium]|jgi:NitT/TauT family transport system ATP-binding protein|nr:nitrate/sulfonate/bicarbonate ABC transporter ATP-binding protein [Caulobacteraceae bacterium]
MASDIMTAPARTAPAPEVLLEIAEVSQTYAKGASDDLLVLDGVNITLKAGEIVGLLGRSGSGKSSLLRIIAGLARPAAGEVRWRGRPLRGPSEAIAMVFQSFALFPWLTVLENVEIGLEPLGIPTAERRSRSLQAIDLIGLDGFENAYPKELSGGMRQRVGFARGLVMQPELLLMDEPFSALDVLTAETLRTDVIDLWMEGRLPLRSILMVSHNIEEAVLMCDRILLFTASPGRVAAEIPITLSHPRSRTDAAFRKLVDQVYERMTNPSDPALTAEQTTPEQAASAGVGRKLPDISTNLLAGLMEALAAPPFKGKADLPELADELTMEVDELFPIAETLQLLGFAEVAHGDIRLIEPGRRFVESDVDGRKRLFSEQLLAHVPIVALVRRVLDERPSRRAPYRRFSEELEDFMSEEFAEETLAAVISWGRYAELFAYDEQAQTFSLEDPA